MGFSKSRAHAPGRETRPIYHRLIHHRAVADTLLRIPAGSRFDGQSRHFAVPKTSEPFCRLATAVILLLLWKAIVSQSERPSAGT
jgi:hypothetical protein